MGTTMRLALCLALASIGCATRASAQGLLAPTARAFHYCTFNRPCNWASHAAIAFGAAYGLHRLAVPAGPAACAAALFYVAKELRDHARWSVLGSADSNGDILSAFAGALLAYYLALPPPTDPQATISVELGVPTRIAVQLEAP